MGIAADDDCPFIHGQVVEHLVNDIGHGMVFAIGITAGDQAEIVHETHEARNIGLRFLIPHGSGVTTGLISRINNRRNHSRRHGLQFLGSHQAGGIL